MLGSENTKCSPENHSTLYKLEPVGLKTPYVESMSSYYTRLSFEHRVLTTDLFNKVVVPLIKDRETLSISKGNISYYRVVNGNSIFAMEFVKAIEKLTLSSELKDLTLSRFCDVFTPRGLLKTHKAWCPTCLEEWRRKNEVVYEPLYWSILPVTVCREHHNVLNTHCPNKRCNKEIPILAPKSRIGYCPYCEEWLGNSFIQNMDIRNIQWESWVTREVTDLLDLVNRNIVKPNKSITFNNIISALAGYPGSKAEFGRAIGCSKTTLWTWYNAKNFPALIKILRICYLLDTRLSDFISRELSGFSYEKLSVGTCSSQPLRQSKKKKSGHTNYDKLISELTLFTESNPPLPLNKVADRLGVCTKTLYKASKALCDLIVERFKIYRKENAHKRTEAKCEEVAKVTLELMKRNVSPTRRLVEKYLSVRTGMREKALMEAWRKQKRAT